jgi:hypothetical protein
VVETHGGLDFAEGDILPGDTGGVLSESLRIKAIVILPGDTPTAGPTLEPGSVLGILLHQIRKLQVRKHDASRTMVTFSIL